MGCCISKNNDDLKTTDSNLLKLKCQQCNEIMFKQNYIMYYGFCEKCRIVKNVRYIIK